MNRPYMNSGSPCWACHAQTDYYLLNKLNEMERITESVRARCEINGKYNIFYITDKPYHKEFSYSPEIKRFNLICNSIVARISPFVAFIAGHADDDGCLMDAYNEILSLCRGDFPSVCTQMERMREEERNRRSREWKASQVRTVKDTSIA